MAKKKAAKKAVKAKKPAKKRPKQQRLNGMEDMPKIRALDAVCEKLADVRETLNESRKKEKELSAAALAHLKAHDRTSYKAHGIELYRVTGDEKIRIRVVDSDEGADVEDGADEVMGGMSARPMTGEEASRAVNGSGQ